MGFVQVAPNVYKWREGAPDERPYVAERADGTLEVVRQPCRALEYHGVPARPEWMAKAGEKRLLKDMLRTSVRRAEVSTGMLEHALIGRSASFMASRDFASSAFGTHVLSKVYEARKRAEQQNEKYAALERTARLMAEAERKESVKPPLRARPSGAA